MPAETTFGWVIAIAAGLQESGLKNLGYGDRDSQGLFPAATLQRLGICPIDP